MGVDPWGVDSGYFDALGQWHDTPAETRRAILSAMGADQANPPTTSPPPVRVVHHGQATEWPCGHLCLEDGTTLTIDGRLPPDLPIGYHDFREGDRSCATRVIVSPGKCALPAAPTWGWAAQLYAARSSRSWGIGDLADLRRLGDWSAGLGAGLVLVNPLYAATPVLPQEASPYYPSSRRFLNPLYLHIEEVPGAAELGAELDGLARAGRELNAAARIDRDAVFRLKQTALERIWSRQAANPELERFCREEGEGLEQFATYCLLASQLGEDWRQWPGQYRSPRDPAVRAFRQAHAREVAYHQWLQWLLDRQLAAAATALPLVQDIPIGVSPKGADAWIWQELLADQCTIGAPPDAFNTQGQDWAMPPLVPHKFRAAGYEPFIQTIRGALRHAKGLRIDHVMGLFRLFWIPQGLGPTQGTYVRYHADELLAILAVESQRSGSFVVGEDLGTVEADTRRGLAEHQVQSFRVLMFEQQVPPERYPSMAMAAATTHDLPTLAGLWTGHDEAARHAIGLPKSDAILEVRRHLAQLAGLPGDAPPEEMIEAVYRLLARAPSLVLLATLDDAMALPDRPNMPGTTTQWPNWCLPLPGGLEALMAAELPVRIARGLDRRSR